MDYPLLNLINCSKDVSDLPYAKLPQLCNEVREFLIENVSKTGGHLSANLGTVELITAMHHSFSTPQDQFVYNTDDLRQTAIYPKANHTHNEYRRSIPQHPNYWTNARR